VNEFAARRGFSRAIAEGVLLAVLFLPAAAALLAYRAVGYFPYVADDLAHWFVTGKIAAQPTLAGMIQTAYHFRGFRPIVFPLLGVIPFLATRSVIGSTQIVMVRAYFVFTALAFRIFRRYAALPYALLCALSLAAMPVVFNSALWYLAELPFVCVCAGAFLVLLEKRRGYTAWASILIGFSLCLRPVEGLYIWGLLGLRECLIPALSGKALSRIALGALVLVVFWFYPAAKVLNQWVKASLVQQPAPVSTSAPEAAFPLGIRFENLKKLVALAYTWPVVVILLLCLAAWWRAGKREPEKLLFAALAGTLPFLLSLFVTNRASAVEARYFMVPVLFFVGYVLLSVPRRTIVVPLSLLLAAPFGVIKNVDVLRAYADGQAPVLKLEEGLMVSLAEKVPPVPVPRLLVLNGTGVPILTDILFLRELERGRDWDISQSWMPGRFFFRFPYDVVVVAGSEPESYFRETYNREDPGFVWLQEYLRGASFVKSAYEIMSGNRPVPVTVYSRPAG
jgi:hypothetical protein